MQCALFQSESCDISTYVHAYQRDVDLGSQATPGRAAEAYAAIKYVDQPNVVPFIVETGGCINIFLDTLQVPRRRLPDSGALQGTVTLDVALGA